MPKLLQLITLISGEPRPLAGVGLGSADPLTKRLVVDRQLRRDGLDGLPLRRLLVLVVKHHPHGPFPDLRWIRRSACALSLWHCSILSREGAVTNPGAIQRAVCSVLWIVRNGGHPRVTSERIAATLRRTSGTSSSSNHAFFLSQMLFRGLG